MNSNKTKMKRFSFKACDEETVQWVKSRFLIALLYASYSDSFMI